MNFHSQQKFSEKEEEKDEGSSWKEKLNHSMYHRQTDELADTDSKGQFEGQHGGINHSITTLGLKHKSDRGQGLPHQKSLSMQNVRQSST